MSAVPLATDEQFPAEPLRLQAWHVPEHGELQQTPCEQYCLPSEAALHSLEPLQEAPGGFKPHEPFTHAFGDTHWLSCVQVSKHRLPLHTYG